MEAVIGMTTLKKELIQLANNRVADLIRSDLGIPITSKRPVMIFQGNPGTGKTSIAYIVAGEYSNSVHGKLHVPYILQ
jgi:DNA polymerase III delta prime subunit